MKIKIDENPPATIAQLLIGLGHEADTVAEEGLVGIGDGPLWRVAVREDRFLITRDVKFADARRTTAADSPGILLLRMEESDMIAVAGRVIELFKTEDVESWRGCSVTATASKVRLRRGKRKSEKPT